MGGCYKLNFMKSEEETVNHALWKKLWKSKIHERLKIFLWRILVGALPTKEVFQTQLGLTETNCVLCERKCRVIYPSVSGL